MSLTLSRTPSLPNDEPGISVCNHKGNSMSRNRFLTQNFHNCNVRADRLTKAVPKPASQRLDSLSERVSYKAFGKAGWQVNRSLPIQVQSCGIVRAARKEGFFNNQVSIVTEALGSSLRLQGGSMPVGHCGMQQTQLQAYVSLRSPARPRESQRTGSNQARRQNPSKP